jgi:5,6-dimethylbenzimidazole synthase
MKPTFDAAFRAQFRELVLWRRDVRRFRRDPIARERIEALIELATHAPSVGLSQPWRFVHVDSADRRLAVIKSFTDANERALAGYSGEKHAIYAGLKLEGLKEAPVHLAVFSDDGTHTGSGLGQQTMPETLHYSVVGAIQTLWLAARADGIGMGWVSILDPKESRRLSLSRSAGRRTSRSRARASSLGSPRRARGCCVHTLTQTSKASTARRSTLGVIPSAARDLWRCRSKVPRCARDDTAFCNGGQFLPNA